MKQQIMGNKCSHQRDTIKITSESIVRRAQRSDPGEGRPTQGHKEACKGQVIPSRVYNKPKRIGTLGDRSLWCRSPPLSLAGHPPTTRPHRASSSLSFLPASTAGLASYYTFISTCLISCHVYSLGAEEQQPPLQPLWWGSIRVSLESPRGFCFLSSHAG
ncbi:hypothetical protein E2C01_069930 [Portunus trituberculatus]|uniref:Uncharacterized protein n=1 Tax=Portunus trituberculatus TaxID=210409 RepID=A0A5B7HSV9_PORTR|nr:hypothetical protein [Portunus trituberculatus]